MDAVCVSMCDIHWHSERKIGAALQVSHRTWNHTKIRPPRAARNATQSEPLDSATDVHTDHLAIALDPRKRSLLCRQIEHRPRSQLWVRRCGALVSSVPSAA
jgi:hypothetical protein